MPIRVIFFLLLSGSPFISAIPDNVVESPSEAPATPEADPPPTSHQFPSLVTLAKSDNIYVLPSPQLDLEPTELLKNSPMSFSIAGPALELEETLLAANSPMSFDITKPILNLEETDLSRNSPMDFSIRKPEFDLEPKFEGIEGTSYAAPEDQAPEPLPLEPEDGYFKPEARSQPSEEVIVIEDAVTETEAEEENNSDIANVRHKRQVPGFPSFSSEFLSPSSAFNIAFPRPDFRPGFVPSFGLGPSIVRPSRGVSSNLVGGPLRPFGAGIRPVRLAGPGPQLNRPVRQFRPSSSGGSKRKPPRYPPLDPFGTVEYIPLPGPSNPAYALPITQEDPFMRPGAHNVVFNRPIRHVVHQGKTGITQGFPNFSEQSSDEFIYSSEGQILANSRVP